ncbi:hypothetical protein [Saccharothrix sp. ST-888]|uniref:hypothetical protein n=1 Tax=Saccharothrix sp. ST-888 TaxID=1427391 RepID=UPI0006970714|nr:hypothetical protein [Saccharothrix sp. ST-888]
MAIITPAAWQQGGTYAARTDRLSVISGFLGYPGTSADEPTPLRTRSGVKPSYQNAQLKVSAQTTPNMSVQVTAGFGYVENRDLAGYGAYTVVNDAPVTLPIAASSGTQYRKDTVVVQVLDAETLGTVNSALLLVVQGPYAASAGAAVRGAIPPNSIVLADIAVNAGVTSITNAAITDGRQYQVGSGGILPVTSATMPDHPHPGQALYATDTDTLYLGKANGTTAQVSLGTWTGYTTTWAGATTNPNIGNGTLVSRYSQVGKTVNVLIKIISGSTTTWGSGTWSWTLPAGLPFSANYTSGLGSTVGTAYADRAAGSGAGPSVVWVQDATRVRAFTTLASSSWSDSVPWVPSSASLNSYSLAFSYETA